MIFTMTTLEHISLNGLFRSFRQLYELKWEILLHLTHYPIFDPSNFYLFQSLQNDLNGKTLTPWKKSKISLRLSLKKNNVLSLKKEFRNLYLWKNYYRWRVYYWIIRSLFFMKICCFSLF